MSSLSSLYFSISSFVCLIFFLRTSRRLFPCTCAILVVVVGVVGSALTNHQRWRRAHHRLPAPADNARDRLATETRSGKMLEEISRFDEYISGQRGKYCTPVQILEGLESIGGYRQEPSLAAPTGASCGAEEAATSRLNRGRSRNQRSHPDSRPTTRLTPQK